MSDPLDEDSRVRAARPIASRTFGIADNGQIHSMAWIGRLHVTIRAVLLAFALILAGILFRQLVTLLVAVLMTVLLAIPLSASATALERRGLPRAIGALAALLAGITVIGGILYLVIPPFAEEAGVFVEQVPAIVDSLQEQYRGLTGSSQELGFGIQDFLGRYTDDPSALIGPLASIGVTVAGVLGAMILIILTAFYVAIDPEPLIGGMTRVLPPQRRAWAREAAERLRAAWIGWMQGVLIDMAITGVLLYLGLTLIGLDFALVFAVFSAVLVLIPYFGAIAGAIPPVLLALTDSPGKALLALGIYVLIQQIESNVTIPLVMAQRVKLHPAVVAIGVVVVGQLFGLIGLFVAVPILSLVVVMVDELWVKPMEDAPTGAEFGPRPESPEPLHPAPPETGAEARS